jgi:hypothetical protein
MCVLFDGHQRLQSAEAHPQPCLGAQREAFSLNCAAGRSFAAAWIAEFQSLQQNHEHVVSTPQHSIAHPCGRGCVDNVASVCWQSQTTRMFETRGDK